ncbi:exodeoxyribonuclease VII small subunit [Reichenbachiella versicolor]|uniref:exodeoxyribonuclease VII small subunit n=1 Tax=Reichenbachiella versicolor TaxID=1821036 RepID=UPI000D6EA383|nr:exodeoxyribonuclease VII small subunit [Reichenbachiella versicolor]
MSKKKLTYQSASEELNNIASQLEDDNVNIDDLEKLVKRGRELVLFCQEKLRSTQEQIKKSEQ